jgi:methionyl aminopeptidase
MIMDEQLFYAGNVNTEARKLAAAMAVTGVSLIEIDKAIEKYIKSMGCIPVFSGYNGFPASSCLSVNDIAVHGVPSEYKLQEGDILKIDVGVGCDDYCTDAASTVIVRSKINDEKYRSRKLLQYANIQILNAGLSQVKDKAKLVDITFAMEQSRDRINYSLKMIDSDKKITIIKSLGGHYIADKIHVNPCILSAFDDDRRIKNYQLKEYGEYTLKEGDRICIEPVVTWGNGEIETDQFDNWSIRTVDGSDASHVEACILVTKEGFKLIS